MKETKETICPTCKGTGKVKHTLFGALKLARESKGITQAQLGEQIGLSAMGVSHFENGNREPKLALVEKWCVVLEVDIKSLF